MQSTFDSEDLNSFDQYLRAVEKHPLFEDREKEREVARRAKEGDREAAHRLVTANLRFVISYVKKYRGNGLSLEELVSIGNVGLVKAIEKYDPDRGVKFISYAVWWIRQTVLQALAEETRSVRIPQNQNGNLTRIRRTETRLTQELGRTPTDREIADEMDERLETVQRLRRVDMPEVRLDAPLKEDERDSATYQDRYADTDASDLEDEVEARTEREFLERMFAEYLTDRERKILVLYYGLDGGEGQTLEEVGELMGVTRERIRQLRNRAFEKLRDSEHGEALKQLW
ncbi:MAG: RNA polymerase sigma factor RpoD/SigA [Candidatus Palauibacterales bacterium]|nr:RNA polymerase sigma factor RpoD/SigA [Candidatus Palauibacterales bacterium]